MPSDSLLSVFLFSFAVGFGAVISPGPVSAAIVSEAPRRGWAVGPLVATGHALLELAIVLLLSLGLSSGLADARVQAAIAVFGGLLLLWIAYGLIRGALRGSMRLPQPGADRPARTTAQLIGLGMAATLSNPYWYAWWVTVAAGYLLQAQALGAAAVMAFYLGHISADYGWDTFLSAVVGGSRRWLTDRMYRGLVLACGLFMGVLGLQFIASGV